MNDCYSRLFKGYLRQVLGPNDSNVDGYMVDIYPLAVISNKENYYLISIANIYVFLM